MTQFSTGLIYSDYIGIINETNWFSPFGNHSFGTQVSHFDLTKKSNNLNKKDTKKGVGLVNYLYSKPKWNWQLELQGGQFWNGDKGIKTTSHHWLGDTKISASYLNSTPKNNGKREQFLTLNMSIPLTPWQDMKPGYLKIRGIDQFSYGLQTRIQENHNILNNGLGGSNLLQHNLTREYQGQGRLTSSYFYSNINKLRNSYLTYINI